MVTKVKKDGILLYNKRVLATSVVGVLLIEAIASPNMFARNDSGWDAVIDIAVLGLLGFWSIFRCGRVGVLVKPAGLRVRNPWWVHKIAWVGIAGFGWTKRGLFPSLTVERNDGKVIALSAFNVSPKGPTPRANADTLALLNRFLDEYRATGSVDVTKAPVPA